MKQWWLIEGRDGYQSQCYPTKGEAIYRLNEIAQEPFYGESIMSRTNIMLRYSDGTVFRVVKL